jgi:hypothetical protein
MFWGFNWRAGLAPRACDQKGVALRRLTLLRRRAEHHILVPMFVDITAILLLAGYIAVGLRLGPLRRLLTITFGLALGAIVLLFRAPISDVSLLGMGALRDAIAPTITIRTDVWQVFHHVVPWIAVGILLGFAWACARLLSRVVMLNLPLAHQLDQIVGVMAGTGIGLSMILCLVNIVVGLSVARDDGPWDSQRQSSVVTDIVCSPPILGCF